MIQSIEKNSPRTDAFIPDGCLRINSTDSGILDGLHFAAKDLIDITGLSTGCGNPDWLKHAPTANHSAPCVESLLKAGATFTGKTVTDELAFSLEGTNAHYGTPLNPRCPERLPGGSSSGSASAVAQDLVDFALGTDTGGSVRVPAAFCGIYGMRPSHGLISMQGVMPFAPSYDCIGWFSRELSTMKKVSKVMLSDSKIHVKNTKELDLYILSDAFELAQNDLKDVLLRHCTHFADFPTLELFSNDQNDWLSTYQILQGREIWENLGNTICKFNIQFAHDIEQRFNHASSIKDDDVIHYQTLRNQFRKRLYDLIPENSAIIIPSTPCLPLLKGSSEDKINTFYQSALTLNSIAGHAGLPQLSIPIGTLDNCPISLSIVGHHGDDLRLLQTAKLFSSSYNDYFTSN